MSLNFRIADALRGPEFKIATRSTRSAAGHPVIAISRSGNVTRMALREGRQIIGGGAECDIVALGMSPAQAFSIDISSETTAGRAKLDVLRDGVSFQDRSMVAGDTAALADGHVVRVDGIDFWLEGVGGATAGMSRRKIAAACLLAISSLLLLAGLGGGDGDVSSATNASGVSQTAGVTPPAILINELKEALRMSGLAIGVAWNDAAGTIDVGEPGQALALAAKSQLTNLIDAFARRSEAPLRDRTRLTSGIEHLVASVALEPVKFIVGTDGKRYREGDAIGGDWKVERIASDLITVARGTQKDDFSLSSPSDPAALRLASNGAGGQR